MSIVSVSALFETHLTVTDLHRSMLFYSEILGLELAQLIPERNVALYWIGERGNSMLGLWEAGTGPQRMSLHLAFKTDLRTILEAPLRLRAADVTPLDFWNKPTDEPVVITWVPAASLYFRDPDGHSLELLSMLPEPPQPGLEIVTWTRWSQLQESLAASATKPSNQAE